MSLATTTFPSASGNSSSNCFFSGGAFIDGHSVDYFVQGSNTPGTYPDGWNYTEYHVPGQFKNMASTPGLGLFMGVNKTGEGTNYFVYIIFVDTAGREFDATGSVPIQANLPQHGNTVFARSLPGGFTGSFDPTNVAKIRFGCQQSRDIAGFYVAAPSSFYYYNPLILNPALINPASGTYHLQQSYSITDQNPGVPGISTQVFLDGGNAGTSGTLTFGNHTLTAISTAPNYQSATATHTYSITKITLAPPSIAPVSGYNVAPFTYNVVENNFGLAGVDMVVVLDGFRVAASGVIPLGHHVLQAYSEGANYNTSNITTVIYQVGRDPKIWNGSAWISHPVKIWNGASWVHHPCALFNGSFWN